MLNHNKKNILRYKNMKIFYFSIGSNFINYTLALVIPCYNEEEVLHETAKKSI